MLARDFIFQKLNSEPVGQEQHCKNDPPERH